jgi:hypothetical protein
VSKLTVGFVVEFDSCHNFEVSYVA